MLNIFVFLKEINIWFIFGQLIYGLYLGNINQYFDADQYFDSKQKCICSLEYLCF